MMEEQKGLGQNWPLTAAYVGREGVTRGLSKFLHPVIAVSSCSSMEVTTSIIGYVGFVVKVVPSWYHEKTMLRSVKKPHRNRMEEKLDNYTRTKGMLKLFHFLILGQKAATQILLSPRSEKARCFPRLAGTQSQPGR